MRPRAVVAGRLTEITRRRASRVGSVYLEGMESVEVIEAVATLTKLQAQLDAATREREPLRPPALAAISLWVA